MEIKTTLEIYDEVKSVLEEKGWPEKNIARTAMVKFAKQFIDLAAEKAEIDYDLDYNSSTASYEQSYSVNKESILDIKQLIK